MHRGRHCCKKPAGNYLDTWIKNQLIASYSVSKLLQIQNRAKWSCACKIKCFQKKTCIFTCFRENPVKSTLISRQTLKLNILWNREYDFAYCPNAKTGTSYWMRQYLTLSHLPQGIKDNFLRQTNLHTTMKQLSRLPGEALATVKQWLLFLKKTWMAVTSHQQNRCLLIHMGRGHFAATGVAPLAP